MFVCGAVAGRSAERDIKRGCAGAYHRPRILEGVVTKIGTAGAKLVTESGRRAGHGFCGSEVGAGAALRGGRAAGFVGCLVVGREEVLATLGGVVAMVTGVVPFATLVK